MLYTRKGDTGTSGLFETKKRLSKGNAVYDALGTVDELNSLLGVCRVHPQCAKSDVDIPYEIRKVQEELFIIQAELAGAGKTITQTQVEGLETTIGHIEQMIQNPHSFVIPGATELSALFDYARTVARRTERMVVKIGKLRSVSRESRAYLNRLSSLLYGLARYAAAKEGVKELTPSY